jgi:outer membrane protein assembly factor BamB
VLLLLDPPAQYGSVAALNAYDGTVKWAQALGGTSSEDPTSVTTDDFDNVIIGVNVNSNDWSFLATPVATGGNVFSLSGTSGSQLWMTTFTPNDPSSLLLVEGVSFGTVSFDAGSVYVTGRVLSGGPISIVGNIIPRTLLARLG